MTHNVLETGLYNWSAKEIDNAEAFIIDYEEDELAIAEYIATCQSKGYIE